MDGIINVYKEAGFTSFDVVAKLRGILKQKKIGHTGTLDPDATGVLPVCLGKGTKVCALLTDKDKVYETTMQLGIKTDTQDISGKILEEKEVLVSEEEVRQVIGSFVGKSLQIPPMYSALKVNGQKLCDLARNGIEVERKSREICVYELEICEMNLPFIKMRIHCSKGTYIRTICNDIGEALGCFGTMTELVRTQVAGFSIEEAYTLSEIENLVGSEEINKILLPVDHMFLDLPRVNMKTQFLSLAMNGNKIVPSMYDCDGQIPLNEKIRVYDDMGNKFIGIYNACESENIRKPLKMFI